MTPVKSAPNARLSRREKSKATHWRIVKAAYGLFCERGFSGTTMTAIAEEADVAVQTVYFTFHTKGALFSRAIDFAVMGEEEPAIPEQQPWYRAMIAAPDLRQAVRHFVTGAGTILTRVTPLSLAARASADPEVAAVMDFHDRWQADGYRAALEILRAKAPLRPGIDPERANQLLLLLVGQDVYHALVERHGWSNDDWTDWVVETVAEQVFAPTQSERRPVRRRRTGTGSTNC